MYIIFFFSLPLSLYIYWKFSYSFIVTLGDLWGPLLICLTLAMFVCYIVPSIFILLLIFIFRTLGITASPGQSAIVFAGVFVVFWFGSGIVTLNGQLLGGKLSFFQSLCILGYCIFPLLSCSIAFLFVRSWLIRFCVLPFGLAWSTVASVAFLSGAVQTSRKILAIYPILLFYFFIAWLIFVQNTVI